MRLRNRKYGLNEQRGFESNSRDDFLERLKTYQIYMKNAVKLGHDLAKAIDNDSLDGMSKLEKSMKGALVRESILKGWVSPAQDVEAKMAHWEKVLKSKDWHAKK